MSFPMPVLDERTFQDLVDEAKRRIPHHTPEWTDHNLSDPGVALIELFAWMTESIVYRLNHAPDHMYRAFLDLVGIKPFPPEPSTVAVTFWVDPDSRERTVPVGTQVATTQDLTQGSIDFRSTTAVTIREPELTFVRRMHTRNTIDLAKSQMMTSQVFTDVKSVLDANSSNDQHRGDDAEVPCFRDDLEPGEAMYFGFRESLAANVLLVDVAAAIHGTGVSPEKPPLVWEVSTDWNQWEPAELDADGDSTNGLNTDGRVLLYLPFNHSEELYGNERAYWLRVRLTDDLPTYAQPPRITRISFRSLGGRVQAEQALAHPAEELGRSTGKPGQLFSLINTPVLTPIASETIQVFPPGAPPEEWTRVDNFALTGAESKHFTLDLATGQIRFGPRVTEKDGTIRQHGQIPPADSRIVMSGYRQGGGRTGNVVADSILVQRSRLEFPVQRINNRKAATGGIDPETVDNAKVRGPLALVTGDRAVTPRDYEYLATSLSRPIATAKCQPSRTDTDPIRLFVVGEAHNVAPDKLSAADLTPDDDLLEELRVKLEERRLIGVKLEVTPPTFRGVSVVSRVIAESHHAPTTVRARCLDALYEYVNPVCGGTDGAGWSWGANVTRSEIAQLLGSVPGVARVEETLFFAAADGWENGVATRKRYGVGLDQFELGEYELPISMMHQVLADRDKQPEKPTGITSEEGKA